jgi:acetophenone carboxylase
LKVEHNWRGDLLVGHLNGGVARIGKTKAVDTIESGPLFGTHASAYLAAAEGLPKVLAVDIGGTTAKASAVLDGRMEMRPEGHFFGIPVRMAMPVLRSIALGGGSVARAAQGAVTLGPESMGAAPGPACYKLGGTNATLTDALVTLGILSPSGFLNGRRILDVAQAEAAIERHVAKPLGLDVATAARQIMACAVNMMAALAHGTLTEAGHANDPDFVLFAYGGNGPLFAIQDALHLRTGVSLGVAAAVAIAATRAASVASNSAPTCCRRSCEQGTVRSWAICMSPEATYRMTSGRNLLNIIWHRYFGSAHRRSTKDILKRC